MLQTLEERLLYYSSVKKKKKNIFFKRKLFPLFFLYMLLLAFSSVIAKTILSHIAFPSPLILLRGGKVIKRNNFFLMCHL